MIRGRERSALFDPVLEFCDSISGLPGRCPEEPFYKAAFMALALRYLPW